MNPTQLHTRVSFRYRYSFQGQESDDEVKGEGNSVNYKYRMHDPRLGRFFAVDPLIKKYPQYSSYGFSGNKVINCKELEGAEELVVTNLNFANRPQVLHVFSASQNQNQVIFIVANNNGGVTSITRPLTRSELSDPAIQRTLNGQENTNSEILNDANGIPINTNFNNRTNSAVYPNVPNFDPPNTTETSVQGDFGATGNISSQTQMVFNVSIASGATSVNIQFNDGGNFPNTFTIIDNNGNQLGSFTGQSGANGVTVSLPNNFQGQLTISVSGQGQQQQDNFSFNVKSSGPTNQATPILPSVQGSQPSQMIPQGGGQAQSVVNRNTTPVQVNSNTNNGGGTPINN